MHLSSRYFFIQCCLIFLSYLKLAHVEAIIGHSREALEQEFPFAVALSEMHHKHYHVFCSGGLITRRHVLTAEHCLIQRDIKDVSIHIGSVHLVKCKAYEAQVWISYRDWKYNNSKRFSSHEVHDVAVVMLKHIAEQPDVHPAIIAKFQPHDVYGSEAKLLGWGLTNGNVTSKVLRTAKLKVLTGMESESEIHQLTHIDCPVDRWELLTKSDPWALTDCGDSGGPLINNRNEIIGINRGTCPVISLILKIQRGQGVNNLLEKRLNVHAGLHYHHYVEFIEHFTIKHVNHN